MTAEEIPVFTFSLKLTIDCPHNFNVEFQQRTVVHIESFGTFRSYSSIPFLLLNRISRRMDSWEQPTESEHRYKTGGMPLREALHYLILLSSDCLPSITPFFFTNSSTAISLFGEMVKVNSMRTSHLDD